MIEKTRENAEEVIPPEEKKEINDETIKIGIACIIEEEKDRIGKQTKIGTPPEILERFKKIVGDAERNFLEGNWDTKELMNLVKGNFQKKKMELEGKIASITRPDRPVFNEEEKNKLKKLDKELREIYAEERNWLERMKKGNVPKEEIAEVLGEKEKSREEGKKEKVEK